MSLSSTNSIHNRIYGLDIVRAFAILTVVFGHGVPILPKIFWGKLYFFCYDGVSVFFVLSGFLIGTILIKILESEKANHKTLFDFMYKRWFRTLPLYYLILGFLTIYFAIWNGLEITDVAKYFIFIQNFNSPHPGFFPEAWSLAVEEWFYLLVPFTTFMLVGIAKLKPRHAVLLVIVSVIIIVTTIRYYKTQTVSISSIGVWDKLLRKQVVTRLDSIVFGLFGAYLNFYYYKYWIKWKGITFGLGLMLFLAVFYSSYYLNNLGGAGGVYNNVFSFSLTSLGVLLTLPLLSNIKHGEGYIYRLVTFFSLISYSLYLVNLVVVQNILLPLTFDYLAPIAPSWAKSYFKYFVYWFYTVSLSYLLYTFFEKPTMRLRNKFSFIKKTNTLEPSDSKNHKKTAVYHN